MTIPFYGSSLFQARKTEPVQQHRHAHSHAHLHHRNSANLHAHSHAHAEFHNRRDEAADLDPRDSTITEVVQTVSVVQIINGSGSTVSAQTLTGSSRTDLLDGETGSTIAVNYKDVATTSADADTDTTATSSSVTATSTADPISATPDATVSSTDTSISATASTSDEASGSATSIPPYLSLTHVSSSSSAFSTLTTTSNSTTGECP